MIIALLCRYIEPLQWWGKVGLFKEFIIKMEGNTGEFSDISG
jgi:hypothetical protein